MIRLREQYPPTVEAHPVQRALRTGEPQFIPDVQAEAESMAHDDEHPRAIQELGNESGIVVPAERPRRTFGAITFGTVPPQPRFGEADFELAVELGRRASVALDNSLLYRRGRGARPRGRGARVRRRRRLPRRRRRRSSASGTLQRPKPSASCRQGDRPPDRRASYRTGRPCASASRPPTHRVPRAETLPIDVKGEERWLSISAARFPGGTVYAFRDMTEERAVEQLKSDFVSTVSHELRTPLAAIYGAALTLQRNDVRLEESQRTGCSRSSPARPTDWRAS